MSDTNSGIYTTQVVNTYQHIDGQNPIPIQVYLDSIQIAEYFASQIKTQIVSLVADGIRTHFSYTIPSGYSYAIISIISGANISGTYLYSIYNVSISDTTLNFYANQIQDNNAPTAITSNLNLLVILYK